MEPDRQIVAGHRLEERQELGSDDRFAAHVAIQLDAASPQVADGAIGFLHGSIGIVERQRGDEARKAVWMTQDQFGHAVVGASRQIDGIGRTRVGFDRRGRDRQDLLIALEQVHDPKAHVEIDQHRDAAHPLALVLAVGGHFPHPGDVGGRKDVSEDVNLAHFSYRPMISGAPVLE